VTSAGISTVEPALTETPSATDLSNSTVGAAKITQTVNAEISKCLKKSMYNLMLEWKAYLSQNVALCFPQKSGFWKNQTFTHYLGFVVSTFTIVKETF